MRHPLTRLVVLAAAGLAAAVGFTGCGTAEDPWADVEGGPTRVLVSFPALYCFAKNVAKEDAAVMSLLTTTGPHGYEPTSFDNLKVRKADLFLVNGLGLDDFTRKVVNSAGNARLKLVKVGEAVPAKDRLTMGEHEHGAGDHEHHDHGFYDPHVWLGIPEAVLMVQKVRDVLQQADPARKAGYEKRAAKYVQTLKALQAEGKDAFAGKKNRKIIATHDSLRYFARSFGLEVVDNLMPQPGVEADAVKLAKLVELCKEQDVRVIAVEPQYSRATAETLGRQLQLRQVPVNIVEVDTLETAPSPIPENYYEERMRRNIRNLAEKLQ